MGRPHNCVEEITKQPNCSDVQSSLNQEVQKQLVLRYDQSCFIAAVHPRIYSSIFLLQILQLQKQLQDQLVARHALEKALSYQQLSYDATIEDSLPKVVSYVL